MSPHNHLVEDDCALLDEDDTHSRNEAYSKFAFGMTETGAKTYRTLCCIRNHIRVGLRHRVAYICFILSIFVYVPCGFGGEGSAEAVCCPLWYSSLIQDHSESIKRFSFYFAAAVPLRICSGDCCRRSPSVCDVSCLYAFSTRLVETGIANV